MRSIRARARGAVALASLLAGAASVPAGENLIANGSFEKGLEGWTDLWTRTPRAGTVGLLAGEGRGGGNCAGIEHTGERDWSFAQARPVPVEPGQIYDFRAWIALAGEGSAELCAILRDARGEVLDWVFARAPASSGRRRVGANADWRQVVSRFAIPPGASSMTPRLVGHGPASVRIDDVALTLEGTMDSLRPKNLPERLEISNAELAVALHTSDVRLSVLERRTGRAREQLPGGAALVVRGASSTKDRIDLRLLEPATMREFGCKIRLEGGRPELVLELEGDGEMSGELAFPPPFATERGEILVLPVNEGIGYPADDATLPPMRYHLYGGHGLCMAWYGQTDLSRGVMAIVETPDDAAVRIGRAGGLLHLAPEWEPQKGRFGPRRVIRYVFIDRGGYVAMAKRYREYSKRIGLFRTLEEKRKANPNVDLLVGAVNVWCWEADAPGLARELQAAGIRRILWSNGRPPGELEALNAMGGVLTSRYDIYQDTMNPEFFPRLRWKHGDWTTAAWARGDIMRGPDGDWIRGWEVETTDGGMIPCGVLCDARAVEYARERIGAELKTHPYRCRFIDTTTASPWRECYDPRHPCTRSESRRHRVELLRVVSEEMKLVCGSETGHDAAVPVVHYFEGMLSLGPYRVPDSGRAMQKLWYDVPEPVAKFQTGHRYRLPLWELVYHDCVVAQWYWGDYNNKLPPLWDRRDLWNVLYGTPPMFMFDRKLWKEFRDRFVQSYRTAAPVARATGYSEMLSHRWLADDRSLQETRFANGIVVTVNFGETPQKLEDGTALGPLAYRVQGLRAEE